jgi:hypothetical protein
VDTEPEITEDERIALFDNLHSYRGDRSDLCIVHSQRCQSRHRLEQYLSLYELGKDDLYSKHVHAPYPSIKVDTEPEITEDERIALFDNLHSYRGDVLSIANVVNQDIASNNISRCMSWERTIFIVNTCQQWQKPFMHRILRSKWIQNQKSQKMKELHCSITYTISISDRNIID